MWKKKAKIAERKEESRIENQWTEEAREKLERLETGEEARRGG